MKKILMIAAASAALMTGCSQSSEVIDNYESESTKAAATEETPVTFGTYLSSAVTRAGKAGDMTTTTLQTTGFGIFAYYTDVKTYSESASSTAPNFMYNQEVKYNSGWSYTPLKYWPNETGTTNIDGKGAVADGADHLSFFAYAPYVSVTASTGVLTDTENSTVGITALSKNSANGDPTVYYTVATDPSKSVDLLWGVIPDGQKWTDVTGTTTTWKGTPSTGEKQAYFPYTDLIKPELDSRVNFLFKHSLAKLDIQVAGAFDQVNNGGTKDASTKITIKNIEVSSNDYKQNGVLNLNNTTTTATQIGLPNWDVASGSNLSLSLGDYIKSDLKEAANPTAMPNVGGVTNTYQSVYNATTDALMLIPKVTGDSNKITVKITYYTWTKDTNLSLGYSRVENVISKDISNLDLQAGFKYTLKLLLGMESVKVMATVDDWDSTSNEAEVDLPINVAASAEP